MLSYGRVALKHTHQHTHSIVIVGGLVGADGYSNGKRQQVELPFKQASFLFTSAARIANARPPSLPEDMR